MHTDYGRLVQALGMSALTGGVPSAVAQHRGWHETSAMLRAAEGVMTGAGSGFVVPDGLASEVIGDIPRNSLSAELLDVARPMASFHSRMLITDAEGLVASTVAEGESIPCIGLNAASILVTPSKLGIIIPYSSELMRDSDAGPVIESDTVLALQRGFDAAIRSMFAPGSAGGIAAGMDALVDIRKLFTSLSLTGVLNPILVASVDTGILMSTLKQSVFTFPEMAPGGGHVCGAPCFVNDQMPAETLLGLNPEAIAFKIGAIQIDMSDAASMELSSAPSQDAATGSAVQLSSMWQNFAIALRVQVSFSLVALRGEHVSEEITSIGWTNS